MLWNLSAFSSPHFHVCRKKNHESIPYLGMVKPEVLSVQQIRCSPCTPSMNSFENMHLLLYYTWIQLHAYARTHAHTLVFAYNHKFYICFIRYHCHPRLATYVISPPGEVPAQPSFSRRLQEAPKRGVWMAFPGRRVYIYCI